MRYRVLGDYPYRVRFCGRLQLRLQILRDIPFIDQFNLRGRRYYQHKGFTLLGKCKSQRIMQRHFQHWIFSFGLIWRVMREPDWTKSYRGLSYSFVLQKYSEKCIISLYRDYILQHEQECSYYIKGHKHISSGK